jgi:hypothetical protein
VPLLPNVLTDPSVNTTAEKSVPPAIQIHVVVVFAENDKFAVEPPGIAEMFEKIVLLIENPVATFIVWTLSDVEAPTVDKLPVTVTFATRLADIYC